MDEVHVLRCVNDLGNLHPRRRGRVVAVGECALGADLPVNVDGHVEGLLDRGTVEVDGRGVWRRVLVASGEAKGIVPKRALFADLVNVEAGVEKGNGIPGRIRNGAPFEIVRLVVVVTRLVGRLLSGGRVHEVFLQVVGVATGLVLLVDEIAEGLIEGKQVVVEVDERDRHDVAVAVTEHAVVDDHSGDVKVLRVVLVDHAASNVRHVKTTVALASDVHLVVLHIKGVDKVLPETSQLVRNLELIVVSRSALRKASANGLIDPDHIAQVVPRPWVW